MKFNAFNIQTPSDFVVPMCSAKNAAEALRMYGRDRGLTALELLFQGYRAVWCPHPNPAFRKTYPKAN